MKSLLIAVMLFLSSAAFAASSNNCSIQASGLSAEATALLVAQCESAVQKQNDPVAQLQQVSGVGTIAKDVAIAIGIAAKEIGIAANEFFESDAGTFVAFILFWKVAGDQLFAIGVALFGLIFILWIVYSVFRRMAAPDMVFEYKPIFFGLMQKKYVTHITNNKISHFESGPIFFLWVTGIVAIVAFFITIGNIMT